LKPSQRLFGSINIVGPFAVRISCDHTLIERPSFRHKFGLGHHPGSPESTGSSESLGIDRRTARLVRHVMSPCLHSEWRFSSLRHDTLEPFNDQDQLRGIGGSEAMLITLP
jgi:hypothetical protein